MLRWCGDQLNPPLLTGRGPPAREEKGKGRPKPVSGINVPNAVPSTASGTIPAMAELIGYARVSTSDQDPALQTDALAGAGCARTFTDQASGTLAERPELTRALDHLRAGDTLVVWRLDRLGRSLRHLVETIATLEDRGVGFRSLQEGIDTTSAGGRLVFHVFGAIAEFERELIRERTHAGLAAARARGRNGGRPRVMTNDKLELARKLYAEGKSPTEIAKLIEVGRSTIYRHLTPKREAA